MSTVKLCPLNHSYSGAVTATEQLCPQMFFMAYSQELLAFSPIDSRGEKTNSNSVRNKEIFAIFYGKAMAIQKSPIQKENRELSEED